MPSTCSSVVVSRDGIDQGPEHASNTLTRMLKLVLTASAPAAWPRSEQNAICYTAGFTSRALWHRPRLCRQPLAGCDTTPAAGAAQRR